MIIDTIEEFGPQTRLEDPYRRIPTRVLEIPVLKQDQPGSFRINLDKLQPQIFILPDLGSYILLYQALEQFLKVNKNLIESEYQAYIKEYFIKSNPRKTELSEITRSMR